MPRAPRPLLPAVLALAAAAPPEQAQATTLVKKNLDVLVQEADGVVVATVTKVAARRDAARRIHSFVTLGGLQVVHGQAHAKDLTLRLPGGQVGDVLQFIEGAPQLSAGDRVVVFIEGNGRRTVPIVGWTQGVFRVVADAAGTPRVHDHEGNRVFGVVAGEVKAEPTRPSEARIVAAGEPVPAGGVGGIRSDAVAASTAASASALTLDQFLAVVRRTAVAKAAAGRVITSVEPGLTADSGTLSDVPAPRERRR